MINVSIVKASLKQAKKVLILRPESKWSNYKQAKYIITYVGGLNS